MLSIFASLDSLQDCSSFSQYNKKSFSTRCSHANSIALSASGSSMIDFFEAAAAAKGAGAEELDTAGAAVEVVTGTLYENG